MFFQREFGRRVGEALCDSRQISVAQCFYVKGLCVFHKK